MTDTNYKIPEQLRNDHFRFVKLPPGGSPEGKDAYEKGWPENPYNWQQISEHHNLGNNYGVIARHGGLVLLDGDRKEITDRLDRLPDTFGVKGSDDAKYENEVMKKDGHGEHGYWHVSDFEKIEQLFPGRKKIILRKDGQELGEIKIGVSTYLVGPGSIHPDTGKPYRITNDKPIASVTTEQLLSIFAEYIEAPAEDGTSKPMVGENGENIESVLVDTGWAASLRKRSDGVLFGVHPIHGSTNGENFHVDTHRNVWFCFRHDTGGGIYELIALAKGKVKCEDCKRRQSPVKGKLFSQIKKIARDEFNIKPVKNKGVANKESIGSQVLRLLPPDVEFFTDQMNDAYAIIDGQLIKIDTSHFKGWLINLLEKETGNVVSESSFDGVINLLKYQNRDNRRELFVRTAAGDGAVFYNLDGKDMVKITPGHWEVVPALPIFRPNFITGQQVLPDGDIAIDELWDFINVPPQDRILFLCWLVTAFIPGFPHPMLYLSGPHGSAKSTVLKIIKILVDPSEVELDSIRESKDITADAIVQTTSNGWLTCFDNLSYLSGSQSDALCRVITGGGQTRRKLFTDNDLIVFNFRHCVALSGVNLSIKNPDLLERTIHFELIRPSEAGGYQSEQELFRAFNEKKPKFLAKLFTLAAQALKLAQDIQIEKTIRFTDFVRYGQAAAKALGKDPKLFLDTYKTSISEGSRVGVDESPIATVLVAFANQTAPIGDEHLTFGEKLFEGMPSELYKLLLPIADKLLVKDDRNWPKNPNWMIRRLKEVSTSLKEVSINFQLFPKPGGEKIISVFKQNE